MSFTSEIIQRYILDLVIHSLVLIINVVIHLTIIYQPSLKAIGIKYILPQKGSISEKFMRVVTLKYFAKFNSSKYCFRRHQIDLFLPPIQGNLTYLSKTIQNKLSRKNA